MTCQYGGFGCKVETPIDEPCAGCKEDEAQKLNSTIRGLCRMLVDSDKLTDKLINVLMQLSKRQIDDKPCYCALWSDEEPRAKEILNKEGHCDVCIEVSRILDGLDE